MKKFTSIILFTLLALTISQQPAKADEICTPTWVDPPGYFDMICEGGGGGEDPPAPDPEPCVPGTTHMTAYAPSPEGEPGMCYLVEWIVDNCTGYAYGYSYNYADSMECGTPPEAVNPCETFEVGGGGITCGGSFDYDFYIEAIVGFPVIYLDLRPFPATLVRWPTAARCGGLTAGTGEGHLNYVGIGGGDPSDPEVGDWRDLTLSLTMQPAGALQLTLPLIGTLALPPTSDIAEPITFQWEVPSHPAAGGGPLAGEIAGLDELPADIPVFVGSARSPYRLLWAFTYEERVVDHEDICVVGLSEDGIYECKTNAGMSYNDGHWEQTPVYEWKERSRNGEVLPWMVAGLPEFLAADLNNDGSPDAYWNYNVTIRRMNDNNRIDDNQWARSWNWGGLVYWAVREGQGQIGWPGLP